MTSFAFILGVVPLVLASGARGRDASGAGHGGVRGMLGVTLFGLLITPVFYVVVRTLVTGRAPTAAPSDAQA